MVKSQGRTTLVTATNFPNRSQRRQTPREVLRIQPAELTPLFSCKSIPWIQLVHIDKPSLNLEFLQGCHGEGLREQAEAEGMGGVG